MVPALPSAFLAEASVLLILLAGAVLLYRSFREPYLLPWMAGWGLLCISRFCSALSSTGRLVQASSVAASVFFVFSIALMTGAIFVYVFRRDLILKSGAALAAALIAGLVEALWFPHFPVAVIFFGLAWRMAVLLASIQLVRFALGRKNTGQWILAFTMLLLRGQTSFKHFNWVGYDIFVDLALGVGMMMIVLDDSRMQVQRLDALNTIAHQLSETSDLNQMAEIVLDQYMRTMPAAAAWFRVVQDETLVLTVQRNISEEFAEKIRAIQIQETVGAKVLGKGEVSILNIPRMLEEVKDIVRAEGFHHLVVVPVVGKTSKVGVIALGIKRFRVYTRNEKNFLKAAANQLGLAAENRGLMQQLVRSRNEWASSFNSIADVILVHDADYRILRANRALLERLKLSRTQVLQQPCEAVLPGAGVRWRGCPYCHPVGGNVSEYDPCFGGVSVVSTSAYTGEDLSDGTVHVIKDITTVKAAEENYKNLFDHMQEGVFVSTPDGKITDCNEAFFRMLGYSSKDEVLQLDATQILYVDQEDRRKFQEQMAQHGFVKNFEYRLRCKDGRQINVIESSFATRDPSGTIDRYQGVMLDVTEMKRVEEQIRRRNRELYALNNIAVTLNQSFDLDEILHLTMRQLVELFSTDTSAVYLFDEENNAMKKKSSFGHRSSWVLGSETFILPASYVEELHARHTEVITARDLPSLPEIMQKFARMETLESFLWAILWRKDKILGLMGTSSRNPREFTSSDESVAIAVGRQLATTIEKIQLYRETRKAYEDLRRTQEQLLQSEKMSAVGQLISGVAHELNNPLTAIIGYAQLLESETLEPRIREFILKLHKQAQRTQKIVQNLLSFARQHKPQRVHVDLRSVMEDTIALRDYDLKVNNIVVERQFQAALPSVVADPHQMEQVFLNIINNAADAMLEGGQGGIFRIRIFEEDGQVVAEFHDSGPGIADPKRVFDPFYTTKGVGKGTGLGLSICYGIVKEHGGEISAHNHPRGGAVIEVRLPQAIGEKPVTERDRIVARRASRLEGRVLLVDDEEAVLDYEREVLTAAGVQTSPVSTGGKAIEALKRERFDAVFLDSKIPGEWTSPDVYRWIRDNQPEMLPRTVLVLSNVSDPSIRAFVDTAQIVCLVKPFEIPDLLNVARRVLRRTKAASAQT